MLSLLARIAFWTALLACYALALMPGDPHVFRYDKYNHMLAFAVLAILGRIGFDESRAVLIGLGLIAFGGLIEISQAMPIIHRDASWGDFGADIIATVGGLLIGAAFLYIVRGRPASPQT